MATLTKNSLNQTIQKTDVGVTVAAVLAGWDVNLIDNGNGRILFEFKGDPKEFSKLEDSYWSGKFTAPARDIIMSQRTLKDRLFSMKKGWSS